MWLSETSPVRTWQYFEKYHFKIQSKNHWYWTGSLSIIIILTYLLAFVQLTWQVDNGWFSPVFDFFMEFINSGPAYVRGGWEGCGDGVGGGKCGVEMMTQIVQFRVTIYDIYMYPQRANIPLYTRPRQMWTNSESHTRFPLLNWSCALVPFHQSWICIVGIKHSGKVDQPVYIQYVIHLHTHAGSKIWHCRLPGNLPRNPL